MIDATVLIPTHRHAAFLPYAIRSALDQEGASVEVLVVGDGVEDATREVLAGFAANERVRFFDLPKAPSRGEEYRHEVLAEASAPVITYLSDDDLLTRDHVTTMLALLDDADLVHSAPAYFTPDRGLVYFPWDLAQPDFHWLMRTGHNSMGLTSATHTVEAYRRLPFGWRTSPAGFETDRYMWLQWLDQPWFRGATSRMLTHLQFPDPFWGPLGDRKREEAVAEWFERSRRANFREELDALLHESVVRGGERFRLKARRYQLTLQSIQETRSWRARERVLRRLPRRSG